MCQILHLNIGSICTWEPKHHSPTLADSPNSLELQNNLRFGGLGQKKMRGTDTTNSSDHLQVPPNLFSRPACSQFLQPNRARSASRARRWRAEVSAPTATKPPPRSPESCQNSPDLATCAQNWTRKWRGKSKVVLILDLDGAPWPSSMSVWHAGTGGAGSILDLGGGRASRARRARAGPGELEQASVCRQRRSGARCGDGPARGAAAGGRGRGSCWNYALEAIIKMLLL
jgi:hypothetical protein